MKWWWCLLCKVVEKKLEMNGLKGWKLLRKNNKKVFNFISPTRWLPLFFYIIKIFPKKTELQVSKKVVAVTQHIHNRQVSADIPRVREFFSIQFSSLTLRAAEEWHSREPFWMAKQKVHFDVFFVLLKEFAHMQVGRKRIAKRHGSNSDLTLWIYMFHAAATRLDRCCSAVKFEYLLGFHVAFKKNSNEIREQHTGYSRDLRNYYLWKEKLVFQCNRFTAYYNKRPMQTH